MDLATLMEQLKVAIKKHQMVVTKISSQAADHNQQNKNQLQRELKDLQEEIKILNEKQKQVVSRLRHELQHQPPAKPPQQQVVTAAHSTTTAARPPQVTLVQKPLPIKSSDLLVMPSSRDHHLVLLPQAPPIRVPRYPAPAKPEVASRDAPPPTVSSSHHAEKPSLPKEQFMKALGLTTAQSITEFRSRPAERKRRTTANPQFSSAALEERRKNAAALENGFLSKRPRGRPRVVTTPTSSSPDVSSPEVSTTTTNGATEHHHQTSPCMTGEAARSEPRAPVSHSAFSAVPKRFKTSWPLGEDLHTLKAAKEEEKQTLLRRSLELKSEQARLQERVRHYTDVINDQQVTRGDLQATQKRLHGTVALFQDVMAKIQLHS